MATTPMRADLILRILQQRHRRDLWLTEVKDGPSTLAQTSRLDALAIKKSWTQPRFVGYEVKISRSDFLRDDKWVTYLPVTHQFSFACPWELIQPNELPSEVGLYWIDADGRLKQVRRPAVRVLTELPTNLLYYVILSRFPTDHHPFFTNQREQAVAYASDRPERRELGRIVGSRMSEELSALEHRKRMLENRIDATRYAYDQICHTLEEAGLPTNEWELKVALASLQVGATTGIDPGTVQRLRTAAQQIFDETARLQSLTQEGTQDVPSTPTHR